ncbi:MAG: hypothetical protein JKY60_14460 [Kordiimonadaceae bacterium]|nr:hypothetical protein [Kordiimonadaceae bacterium]
MTEKFPITHVAKAALLAPLDNKMAMLKAIGLLLLAILAGSILLVIFAVLIGIDLNAMQAVLGQAPAGDSVGAGSLFGLLIGYILLIIGIVTVFAYIFNHWVRLAAFGPERAKFPTTGRAVSAAFINMIKFVLIGIIVLLVAFVVNFVLQATGLANAPPTSLADFDFLQAQIDGFAGGLIMTVVSCAIYSLFSSNLTQTALGSDEESLQHPHTVDFAVSLMLIYAVVLISSMVAALIGSLTLFWLVSGLTYLLVIFSVPVAHGLRYRICAGENRSPESPVS